MSRQVAKDARPIEIIGQLTDYFLEGAKPRSDWGHGIEHEWIGILTDSGDTVPFDGERSVVSVLCSDQLICPFGRLVIVRHVRDFFHEPVSQ
jgi:gamma-glutamylcysteine synthetase